MSARSCRLVSFFVLVTILAACSQPVPSPTTVPSTVPNVLTPTVPTRTAIPSATLEPSSTSPPAPATSTAPPPTTEPTSHGFGSYAPAVSADGRFVAFVSEAADLVAGDDNECPGLAGRQSCPDVFVFDRRTGALELVSVTPTGSAGNNRSLHPTISADGRFVAFWSEATDLVAGDNNSAADVFVRDRSLGTTVQVRPVAEGLTDGGVGSRPAISANGRFVVFEWLSTDLGAQDVASTWNVLVQDLRTGTTQRISDAPDGRGGDGPSLGASISTDGRWVAFWSWAGNLVPGDTERCEDGAASINCGDVFVYDRQSGEMARYPVGIGWGLGGGDYTTSIAPDGSWLVFDGRFVDRATGERQPLCGAQPCGGQALSADGRFVAGEDARGQWAYDRQTGAYKTLREFDTPRPSLTVEGPDFQGGVSLSADGRWAAFATYESGLGPSWTRTCYDLDRSAFSCFEVYLRDRETGATQRISAPPATTPTPVPAPAVTLGLRAEWTAEPVHHLAWSADGALLGVGSSGGVYVYHTATLQPARWLAAGASVQRVAFSPDGRLMAGATSEGKIALGDVETGQALNPIVVVEDEFVAVTALAFSPDSRWLAWGNFNGQVRLFDVASGQQRHAFQQDTYLDTEQAEYLAFSPDGRYLAADSALGMWLWEVESGDLVHRLERPGTVFEVRSLAFSADSRTIIAAGFGTLSTWDVATGTLRRSQSLDTYSALAVAPDGSAVAAVGDSYIELRDPVTGEHRLWLTGHTGHAASLAFSPDGRRLAAADGNATLWIWDVNTGQVQVSLDRHAPGMSDLAFSPECVSPPEAPAERCGQTVVWSSGYRVWKWDRAAGTVPQPAFDQPLPVSGLAFSPDGRLLAAGSLQPSVRRPAFATGTEVRVWDMGSGELVHLLPGHGDAVSALAFSPECVSPPGATAERCGGVLATGGLDTLARLWDTATGALLHELAAYQTSVVDFAFSPDGQTLLTLAAVFEGCLEACNRFPWSIFWREEPEPLRLWQVATGQLLNVPADQQEQYLYTLDLSPDGELLASGTGRGIVLLDGRSGEAPRVLARALGGRPIFSPDGRYLITTNEGTVVFLDATTGRVVTEMEAHSGHITSFALSAECVSPPEAPAERCGLWLATTGSDGAVRLWEVR